MSHLIGALVSAFILTVIIEFTALYIIFRNNPRYLLLYSILINGVTNPLLNYLYLFHYPVLWILEAGVIAAEVILIRLLCEIRWRKACNVSLGMNCASLMGWIILSFSQ